MENSEGSAMIDVKIQNYISVERIINLTVLYMSKVKQEKELDVEISKQNLHYMGDIYTLQDPEK